LRLNFIPGSFKQTAAQRFINVHGQSGFAWIDLVSLAVDWPIDLK